MQTMNATDVRKEWSAVCDSVIHEKPRFIKRLRDTMMLADIRLMEAILEPYRFHATRYVEDDGSITLSLDEMDIAENGADERRALEEVAKEILVYAEMFYEDFAGWAVGYRKKHIPYILRALILNDVKKIMELITCHPEV